MSDNRIRILSWLFAMLVAIYAFTRIWSAVQEGFSSLGLLLLFPLVIVVFAGFDLHDYILIRNVRKMEKGALVLQLCPYPQVVAQIRKLSSLSTVPVANSIGLRRHLTLSVGKSSISIYGGLFKPRAILIVPREYIDSVSITKAPEGRWNLEVLSFLLTKGRSPQVLNAPVMVKVFGIPLVKKGTKLQKNLDDVHRVIE